MANVFKVKVDENGVNYLGGDGSQPIKAEDILRAMKTARAIDIAANVVLIVGAVYFIAFFNQGIKFNWLIIGIVGLVVGAVLKFLARFKLPVRFEYDLSDIAERTHAERINAWQTFLSSQTVWEVSTEAAIANRKTNSGAEKGLQRIEVKRPNKLPFYISVNKPSCIIKLKGKRLVILPNGILTQKGGKFSLTEYSSVQIKAYKEKFVENGIAPSDAEIVGQTWQYVNKDGTPDGRYSNNLQFPVYLYGYLELSGLDLNIKLSCSNSNGIDEFTRAFQTEL